jgi:hypothetical protein
MLTYLIKPSIKYPWRVLGYFGSGNTAVCFNLWFSLWYLKERIEWSEPSRVGILLLVSNLVVKE